MNSKLAAVTTLVATSSRVAERAVQRAGLEPLRVVGAVSSRREE